jgi:hypothetical protein
MRTGRIVAADEVTAEVTIEPAMSAFAEEIDVVIGQHVLFGLAAWASGSPPAFPYDESLSAGVDVPDGMQGQQPKFPSGWRLPRRACPLLDAHSSERTRGAPLPRISFTSA